MQASEKPIQDVVKKEHTFVIPPYQRPYTWDEENTKQLLTDIKEAMDGQEKEYFIGSIVTIEREKNSNYEVVDGQQRITTINILFSALHDLVSTAGLKRQLRDRLVQEDVYTEPPEQLPRLQVRHQDSDIFSRVVINGETIDDLSDLSDSQLRIIGNKKVALQYFSLLTEAELKKFSQYLEKQVYLVFISADKFDSALRLFNVLNARGVPLGNGDMLKSHLYGLVKDKVRFEQDWSDIEAEIGISDLDAFLGHFRTSLVADKARKTLYVEIVDYLKATKTTPEVFMAKATAAARVYSKVFSNQIEPPSSRKFVTSLREVTHDDWIPPLLAFFLSKRTMDLTKAKFLSLLERMTYQMWIAGFYRDARNQGFYRLIRAINSPKASVAGTFSGQLNAQLRPGLDGDLYGKGFARAVLIRIELEAQDEAVEKIFNGPVTIEHVLPQDWSDPYWKSRFNEEDHKIWIHKFGNLTLLSGSKNSSAKNADFGKKKVIYNERNKKVSFDMTKEVCLKQSWTPAVVKKRHDHLVNEAVRIWKI